MTDASEVKPRILAVDDEKLGVDLMVRSLRSVGEVVPATSGEAAWERLEREHFDLVVSDQRMPGISGVELLSRVARRGDHVGRILLTGYADIHATVDAINEGQVHAYLHKPCPPDVMVLTVHSVLERVELANENARLLQKLRERNHALEIALRELRSTQKRMVEAERLSAIGQMIASIVHDFRSPLSVLHSAGRALTDGSALAGEDAADCAGQVVEESNRMARMCDELLEVTQASTGGATRVMDELDPVVESAMIRLVQDASRRGVEIELDLASEARLPLDEDRLRRALLNLGYNALDAMPEGGLLHVSTVRDGETAVVAVRDTGHGIPEEIRERIFEPFVTAGKRKGTGLGLAIVQRVVAEHDGTVEVGKPEGGGSVFELHLPISCAPESD